MTYQEAFEVESLQVSVQQPLRAENFQVEPGADFVSQEEVNGTQFTTYDYRLGLVPAGKELVFAISYTKPDDRPSVTATAAGSDPATPADGGAQTATSPSPLNTTVIIVLVAFVVILGFFLLSSRQQALQKQNEARRGQPPKLAHAGGSREKGGKKSHKTPASGPKVARAGGATSTATEEERKKIRRMLLDGKISEDTYKQLLQQLEEEGR